MQVRAEGQPPGRVKYRLRAVLKGGKPVYLVRWVPPECLSLFERF